MEKRISLQTSKNIINSEEINYFSTIINNIERIWSNPNVLFITILIVLLSVVFSNFVNTLSKIFIISDVIFIFFQIISYNASIGYKKFIYFLKSIICYIIIFLAVYFVFRITIHPEKINYNYNQILNNNAISTPSIDIDLLKVGKNEDGITNGLLQINSDLKTQNNFLLTTSNKINSIQWKQMGTFVSN